jgi:hypothetical protein
VCIRARAHACSQFYYYYYYYMRKRAHACWHLRVCVVCVCVCVCVCVRCQTCVCVCVVCVCVLCVCVCQVSNLHKGIEYKLNLVNMTKSKSLYNKGLRPLTYSEQRLANEVSHVFLNLDIVMQMYLKCISNLALLCKCINYTMHGFEYEIISY